MAEKRYGFIRCSTDSLNFEAGKEHVETNLVISPGRHSRAIKMGAVTTKIGMGCQNRLLAMGQKRGKDGNKMNSTLTS